MEDGVKPGKRYGHSLVFYKPYLILFGGNLNNEACNDVWTFNSEIRPLKWTKLQLDTNEKCPPPRVYHSAGICSFGAANGMMIVFGGRQRDGKELNDMWGLRRHRNGLWDWMQAPNKSGDPKDRIQHSSLLFGQFFINVGGRSQSLGDSLPIEVYDTENGDWYSFFTFKRFRHSSFIYGNDLFIHGGLEDEKHNSPAKNLSKINLLELFETCPNPKILTAAKNYVEKKTSEMESKKAKEKNANKNIPNPNVGVEIKNEFDRAPLGFNQKEMTLCDHAVVYAGGADCMTSDFRELAKLSSLDNIKNYKETNKMNRNNEKLHEIFIRELLKPKDWINKDSGDESMVQPFQFEAEDVIKLIDEVTKIVEDQPMVLKVEAPVKIFGDIHGQYNDLMRFFDLYSAPITGPGGDIEGLDYIFLGDYVDRGNYSLETICLLMALKIKFPNQIHMLRGNHEDRWINSNFGFQKECIDRLADDPDNGIVFTKFNDFFDFLPLAAIVDDTVLCIHGGIGSAIASVSDIEKIKRPLEVVHEVTNIDQQLVVDILWSDPTDSDSEVGIQPNSTRDPTGVGNIVKFGPDRVESFLKNNNLTLILRAHECVMDGFERFAGGKLITVFSATDYCGKHKNAGAILFLTKNYEIKPYLIYPQDCPNVNWRCDIQDRPPTPPRNRPNSANSNGRKNSFS